jgi:hypothetical protein
MTSCDRTRSLDEGDNKPQFGQQGDEFQDVDVKTIREAIRFASNCVYRFHIEPRTYQILSSEAPHEIKMITSAPCTEAPVGGIREAKMSRFPGDKKAYMPVPDRVIDIRVQSCPQYPQVLNGLRAQSKTFATIPSTPPGWREKRTGMPHPANSVIQIMLEMQGQKNTQGGHRRCVTNQTQQRASDPGSHDTRGSLQKDIDLSCQLLTLIHRPCHNHPPAVNKKAQEEDGK